MSYVSGIDWVICFLHFFSHSRSGFTGICFATKQRYRQRRTVGRQYDRILGSRPRCRELQKAKWCSVLSCYYLHTHCHSGAKEGSPLLSAQKSDASRDSLLHSSALSQKQRLAYAVGHVLNGAAINALKLHVHIVCRHVGCVLVHLFARDVESERPHRRRVRVLLFVMLLRPRC